MIILPHCQQGNDLLNSKDFTDIDFKLKKSPPDTNNYTAYWYHNAGFWLVMSPNARPWLVRIVPHVPWQGSILLISLASGWAHIRYCNIFLAATGSGVGKCGVKINLDGSYLLTMALTIQFFSMLVEMIYGCYMKWSKCQSHLRWLLPSFSSSDWSLKSIY